MFIRTLHFHMKKLFLGLVILMFSAFSYADETCSIDNDSLNVSELSQCVSEELKNDETLRQAKMLIGEERFDSILDLIKSTTSIDLTTDELPDNRFSILQSIEKLNTKYIGVLFGLVALVIIILMIWRGRTGTVIDRETAPFAFVIFGMAVAVNSGAFLFVTQFLLVLSLLVSLIIVGYCVFPIFVSMNLDNKLLQTQLKEDADEFAKAIVKSQLDQHTNDLIGRKIVAVEVGRVEYAGNNIKIDLDDYMGCLVNHLEEKSNFKLYVAPSIRNSIHCSSEEFGWRVYKVGSILDEKSSSVSLPIIKEIDSSEAAIRNLALTRIKNHCAMIYRVSENSSGKYQTFCLNQNANGFIPNNDGLAKTYEVGEVIGDSEIKAKEKELVDRISSVAYVEMLKAANSKTSIDELKKLSYSSKMKIISLGSEYKTAYLAAAHEVIALKINDEVVIKKNKLQFGFNTVENLKEFKGYGSVDLFGFANYLDSLNDSSSLDEMALSIVKTISGNSISQMGIQYKDCLVKNTCSTPSYNPFYPVVSATKKVTAFISFMYAGSVALTHQYKVQADEFLGKDPYLNAKYLSQKSISDMLFGMLIAILIGIFVVISVFVIFYLTQIFIAFAKFFIFPWSFGLLTLKNAIAGYRKEDTESFNGLLKRAGFYDMATRLPLLTVSSALGLITLNVLLFVCSIVLQGIFQANMAFFENGGLIMNITAGLTYVVMYVATFLVSLIVIVKTCNSEYLRLSSDLNHGTDQQNRLGEESLNKVKGLLSKI